MASSRHLLASTCAVMLIAVFLVPLAAGQTVMEVIALKYRTAEQVIPLVKPMLARDGSVSGAGRDLVVRTTRSNLNEIRRLIAKIDVAPRQLRISLREDSIGVSGRSVRRYSTHRMGDDYAAQTLQVLEGAVGFISMGESRPVTTPQVLPTIIAGRAFQQAAPVTDYREATSGFYVVARTNGDAVTVDLSSRREAFDPGGSGAIRSRNLTTTVSGLLGEWIDIAAIGQSSSNEQLVVLGRTSIGMNRERRVLMKVEDVR